MSSAICFNLDQSKILLSGNGLKSVLPWEASFSKIMTTTWNVSQQSFLFLDIIEIDRGSREIVQHSASIFCNKSVKPKLRPLKEQAYKNTCGKAKNAHIAQMV